MAIDDDNHHHSPAALQRLRLEFATARDGIPTVVGLRAAARSRVLAALRALLPDIAARTAVDAGVDPTVQALEGFLADGPSTASAGIGAAWVDAFWREIVTEALAAARATDHGRTPEESDLQVADVADA